MARIKSIDNWKQVIKLQADVRELQCKAEVSAEHTLFMGDAAEYAYFKGQVRAYEHVLNKIAKLLGIK